MKFAAALSMIMLLLTAPPVWAQRPLSANQLPKSGVVDYEGTFSGFDFTASISITVDFGARTVSADLRVPVLGSGVAESPPQHYAPTGVIDADGGLFATGTASGSPVTTIIGATSVVFLAGNFFTGQAKTAAGQFLTQFCFEDCGVIRTRSGTFTANRVR